MTYEKMKKIIMGTVAGIILAGAAYATEFKVSKQEKMSLYNTVMGDSSLKSKYFENKKASPRIASLQFKLLKSVELDGKTATLNLKKGQYKLNGLSSMQYDNILKCISADEKKEQAKAPAYNGNKAEAMTAMLTSPGSAQAVSYTNNLETKIASDTLNDKFNARFTKPVTVPSRLRTTDNKKLHRNLTLLESAEYRDIKGKLYSSPEEYAKASKIRGSERDMVKKGAAVATVVGVYFGTRKKSNDNSVIVYPVSTPTTGIPTGKPLPTNGGSNEGQGKKVHTGALTR